MKIDKAIAVLQRTASDGIPRGETAFNDAVKLGIEALKAIRSDQLAHRPGATTWLKGEDK